MTGGFREDYRFERKPVNHEIHETHENRVALEFGVFRGGGLNCSGSQLDRFWPTGMVVAEAQTGDHFLPSNTSLKRGVNENCTRH